MRGVKTPVCMPYPVGAHGATLCHRMRMSLTALSVGGLLVVSQPCPAHDGEADRALRGVRLRVGLLGAYADGGIDEHGFLPDMRRSRSEDRRVGKERRFRWP